FVNYENEKQQHVLFQDDNFYRAFPKTCHIESQLQFSEEKILFQLANKGLFFISQTEFLTEKNIEQLKKSKSHYNADGVLDVKSIVKSNENSTLETKLESFNTLSTDEQTILSENKHLHILFSKKTITLKDVKSYIYAAIVANNQLAIDA